MFIFGMMLLVTGALAQSPSAVTSACVCTTHSDPVCGSDSKTYGNPCLYECAKAANSSLSMVATGVCPHDCPCPHVFDPVCGSDGATYLNECYLKCESSAALVHNGLCIETTSQEPEIPPCTACTLEYDPVCGSDGQTYANPCLFRCGQFKNSTLTMVRNGECLEATTLEPEIPPCTVCTYVYNPVCGSDGQTYPNPCEFRCAQFKNSTLTMVKKGECPEATTLEPEIPPCTVCPYVYNPVCASDGQTYPNLCEFRCAQFKNSTLTMIKKGECPEATTVEPEIPPCTVCTYEYNPVCGSDGQTYPNPCAFRCAQFKNSTLTIVRKGECLETTSQEPDVLPCACSPEYHPVCGSDGVTYGNLCTFECAQSRNSSLTLVLKGKCPLDNETGCVCPTMYQPVCGSDGTTYTNECFLKCLRSAELVHYGPCSETTSQGPDFLPCTACTLEYDPVCGSDGVTYGNLCLFKCALFKNSSLTMAKMGECAKPEENCVCPYTWVPVCGSDGKTYPNECVLKCKHGVKKVHRGPCSEMTSQKPEPPPCSGCSQEYDPVCGNDGQTYDNLCLFKCAQSLDSNLTMVSMGKCEDNKDDCECSNSSGWYCGVDGKTYRGDCEMVCNHVKVAYEGPCIDERCNCSKEFDKPVCGSDGVFYNNQCMFKCAQASNKNLISLFFCKDKRLRKGLK